MTTSSDPTPDLTPEASAEPSPGGVTGRDRLVAALGARWSRGQAVAGILLALLGFAAAVQVRANGRDDAVPGARQADLIALIQTLGLATDRAEAELADLQRTRDSLRDDAEATRTALSVARAEAQTLGVLAGTLPVTGPGLRVTVVSSAGEVGTDQLLNGLEELRNAGAEAIEINDDVRVIAQTGITDSPRSGLLVDGVRVAPPYVVDVIGNADTMATALGVTFTEDVEAVGGKVDVKELDDVEIATTREVTPMRFARPVDEE